MTLVRRSLRQQAVLWPYHSDDNYGELRVSAARPLRCRWEIGGRKVVRFIDSAVVQTDVVLWADEELILKSVIWLGDFRYLPAAPTPLYTVNLQAVIPDIKGRKVRRMFGLSSYNRETLPEIVS